MPSESRERQLEFLVNKTAVQLGQQTSKYPPIPSSFRFSLPDGPVRQQHEAFIAGSDGTFTLLVSPVGRFPPTFRRWLLSDVEAPLIGLGLQAVPAGDTMHFFRQRVRRVWGGLVFGPKVYVPSPLLVRFLMGWVQMHRRLAYPIILGKLQKDMIESILLKEDVHIVEVLNEAAGDTVSEAGPNAEKVGLGGDAAQQ